MAELSGKVAHVEYGGGHVADLDNWELTIDTDMIDVTSFTTGTLQWREMIDGLSGWSGSANFNYNVDSTGLTDLITNTLTPTTASILFGMDKVGGENFNGSAYISSLSVSAPIDGKVSGSVSIQGNGALSSSSST